MAISASDILVKLSTTSGSAGNSTAAGAVGSSLGKYISTTQLTDNTLNNLFPDVTGDENAASNVDYQCIFIHNAHATLTYQAPVKAWLSAEVAGGASVSIGVDPAGPTVIGSSSAQAAIIASKDSAPSGVTFSAPTTKSAGVSLGAIPAGQCVAVWVRRTSANSAALNNDGVTINVSGDSAA